MTLIPETIPVRIQNTHTHTQSLWFDLRHWGRWDRGVNLQLQDDHHPVLSTLVGDVGV